VDQHLAEHAQPHEATLYPGIGIVETAYRSGAERRRRSSSSALRMWTDRRLARELTALSLPGVRFEPTQFTPHPATSPVSVAAACASSSRTAMRYGPVMTASPSRCAAPLVSSDLRSTRIGPLLKDPATLEAIRANRPLSDRNDVARRRSGVRSAAGEVSVVLAPY